MLSGNQSEIETESRYNNVANYYHHRPSYDPKFFKKILTHTTDKNLNKLIVADIGSGDGASRKALALAGCDPDKIYEIEPNGAMRELSHKSGGLHISSGTAAKTGLPNHQTNVVIFCNSIHQATTNEMDFANIKSELNRIMSADGRLIFVAQRFNPQNKIIQDLHNACEKWKKEGLYPGYGDNGIKFILNNQSDIENTKSILKGYPDMFMEKGYQEEHSVHQLYYNEEQFLGLMKSYLSFPVPAKDELIKKIREFFTEHADDNNKVTISCAQVAFIGKPLSTQLKCKL